MRGNTLWWYHNHTPRMLESRECSCGEGKRWRLNFRAFEARYMESAFIKGNFYLSRNRSWITKGCWTLVLITDDKISGRKNTHMRMLDYSLTFTFQKPSMIWCEINIKLKQQKPDNHLFKLWKKEKRRTFVQCLLTKQWLDCLPEKSISLSPFRSASTIICFSSSLVNFSPI